jgi:hypothetical protein
MHEQRIPLNGRFKKGASDSFFPLLPGVPTERNSPVSRKNAENGIASEQVPMEKTDGIVENIIRKNHRTEAIA